MVVNKRNPGRQDYIPLAFDFAQGKQDYKPGLIEKKWQDIWEKRKIYSPDLDKAKKPFYNLMMFPYPSAEGMHVGNMYAFTGADIYGRFMRMKGYNVFEPIGLDGFGIHSENYAIRVGRHPREQAKISEANFYRQLRATGNGFDWSRKLETYDPKYYKWTQWLFIQLFKTGLGYRAKAKVNWCPSCKTVLADEQVINKIKYQKSNIKNTNQKSKISVVPRSVQHVSAQDKVEEINVNVCERCETEVVKKDLEQWFFRITEYADRLLGNIEKLDWTEKVKIAQRQWIGRSEGAKIEFRIQNSEFRIPVFTTRPDTLFGATFLVLSPEHPVVASLLSSKFKVQSSKLNEVKNYLAQAKKKTEQERLAEGKDKTGVFTGLYAINPVNNEKIPVWIADYVLMEYGTGAIMAVPAHDQRDFEFAKKYDLSIKQVILPTKKSAFADTLVSQTDLLDDGLLNLKTNISNYKRFVKRQAKGMDSPRVEPGRRGLRSPSSEPAEPTPKSAYTDFGILVNSGKYSGLSSKQAIEEITSDLGKEGVAKKEVTYHLRDWLISRQRYWGPPIPMIYCQKCGWQPVPEKDLPVLLPDVKDWKPRGTEKSPLATVESFVKTTCPNCKGPAKRETDVSDTFLDSAWYFLRYTSTDIESVVFDIERAKKWLPVKMYIGGAEHSVLHLLYSRFITMALKDLGFISFDEPFRRFFAHGLLIKEGGKMSKSKGNVVVPDEYIRKFGADTLRLYLMFLGPFSQGGDFYDTALEGMYRFVKRIWRLFSEHSENSVRQNIRQSDKSDNLKHRFSESSEFSERLRTMHRTIKKVTEDISNLRYNTAIASLMEWYNFLSSEFRVQSSELTRAEVETFLKLLAPFAPHVTEELFQQFFGSSKFSSIHLQPWPKYDPQYLEEDEVTIVVQVNGRVRDTIKIQNSEFRIQSYVEELARKSERVKKHLQGKEVKKVVYVEGKVINFATD